MERENKILKDQINDIENKLLETNIVMHGVEKLLKRVNLKGSEKLKP